MTKYQLFVANAREFVQENLKMILVGFGIGVFVVTSFFSYTYFSKETIAQEQTTTSNVLGEQTEPVDLGEPPEDLNTVGILLLGYGGAGHEGGFLTDVIQVLHINFLEGNVALVSIPRDLWVDLPDGKAAKINKAFSMSQSGAEVAKDMAEHVTGLRIDYFIAIDFVGLQRLIGYELQGIEVNVGETLDDPWYPIKGEEQNVCGKSAEEVAELTQTLSGFELERQFECRYEHLHFNKGKVAMEGGDVLKYVRSRHGSAGGDFSRSKRQHEVLDAIKKKLISLDGIVKAPKFYEAFKKHVQTDISIDTVKHLQPALQGAEVFDTTTIVLSTDNVFTNSKSSSGQFIVVPNNGWQNVRNYVQEHLVN